MLQGVEPASNHEELSEENGSSLQLRNLIRQRHAEWSDKKFGCVGPVGPLKHLSKEALEAAAEQDDLSEWADMQFLLWDAQRRAGISDAEITAAMEDKLKINMERQWPEPKDGEPRLHIKEPGNSPVTPDSWISCSDRMPDKLIPVMVMYEDGEMWSAMWNGNRWDDGTEYPDPHSVTHWREMPAAPQQEVK
ncbi:dATP/dGTP pyrophosphohydrolase domain-containing protein [Escherichia coli]